MRRNARDEDGGAFHSSSLGLNECKKGEKWSMRMATACTRKKIHGRGGSRKFVVILCIFSLRLCAALLRGWLEETDWSGSEMRLLR